MYLGTVVEEGVSIAGSVRVDGAFCNAGEGVAQFGNYKVEGESGDGGECCEESKNPGDFVED